MGGRTGGDVGAIRSECGYHWSFRWCDGVLLKEPENGDVVDKTGDEVGVKGATVC